MENQTTPIAPTLEPAATPQKPKNFLLIGMILLVLILLASTGFLTFQNYQLRKEISQLQASPSPTPTPDPTANWKTYSSQEFMFSFRYPQEWSISSSERPIFITNEKGINKLLIDPDVNLRVIGIGFCSVDPGNENCEALEVNGKSITIAWSGNSGSAMFTIDSEYRGVSLTLVNAEETDKTIFRQILSTFKFTD